MYETRNERPRPASEKDPLVPVSPPAAPRAREKAARARFVLATDLDGTFLGGSETDRHTLYTLFRQLADDVLLLFVTGRGLERILPLLNDPVVPDPDLIIADVGATAVYGDSLEPVQPLQTEIESRWPGMLAVRRALEPWPWLRLQDVPQQRRCSFEMDEDGEVPRGVEEAVADLGCGLLRSAGRYLDILPHGVDKGTTLRRLLTHLDVPDARVVVAGDTLNDEALFDLGLKGICVGGAEEGLREAVADRKHVHVATRKGAGGILEGLERFDLLDDREAEGFPAHPDGEAQLLMVYHRLPFDEVLGPAGVERRPPSSPNGIIPSLLRFFADGRSGAWVAWSMQPSREVGDFEARVPVDAGAYPRLTASRIPLTAEDVALFYKQFSKEAFWPIIFSFPSRAEFDAGHWEHYLEINRLFAERVAREAERDALVWVHEYNLWMVPGLLRQLRPDLRIAFFHHTAFPPADIFGVLPWRHDIVGSLLACDYIGFHVPRYVENFVDVVKAHGPARLLGKQPCAPRYVTYGCALGVEEVTRGIEVGGRRVGLGAHPVGVDSRRITDILSRESARRRIAELEEELGGRACIFSAERLDYVKGPLEKLQAYESLLEEHPDLHGHIVLVSVVTPAAQGMEIYEQTRAEVDRAVGRINGRFGRIDWTPVRYFFRALPFEELLAYYAVADVAWITPLRDGLNLVAKEFVASQVALDHAGVLVLSEFAGAAVELHGAVLTNPYDVTSMREALYRALTLPAEERADRMRRLGDIVRTYDLKAWGRSFLEAASAPVG